MEGDEDLSETREVLLKKNVFKGHPKDSLRRVKEEAGTRVLDLLELEEKYKKLIDTGKYEQLAFHFIGIYIQERYSKTKNRLIPLVLEEIYDMSIEARNYRDAINISSKVLGLFQGEGLNQKISDWHARLSKAQSLKNMPK